MKILAIMVKNTAALDYVAPVLWKIKQARPESEVTVLFCRLTRRQFLRSGQFYDDLFRASQIQMRDFADFLPPRVRLANPLWRALFQSSERDRVAGRAGEGGMADRLSRGLLGRVRYSAVLPELQPDVALLDHTASGTAQLRGNFNAYMARGQCRVVLLPHAPHHAEPVAFTPYERDGEFLPTFCQVWMPFLHDRTWEAAPAQREQFHYIGYPGLDSSWLQHCLRGAPEKRPTLRCLFVIRRFLQEGQVRAPGDNAYVYDHAEFMRYVRLLHTAVQQSPVPVEVVVKPHPSNDFRAVTATLHAAGITNWGLTDEPIYALLKKIDLVVSLYSTVFFMPAMAGIPTITLHTSTQDLVNQWDRMDELYGGFANYLKDPEQLPGALGRLVADIKAGRQADAAAADVAHLRRFYPDGSLDRALAAIGLGGAS